MIEDNVEYPENGLTFKENCFLRIARALEENNRIQNGIKNNLYNIDVSLGLINPGDAAYTDDNLLSVLKEIRESIERK